MSENWQLWLWMNKETSKVHPFVRSHYFHFFAKTPYIWVKAMESDERKNYVTISQPPYIWLGERSCATISWFFGVDFLFVWSHLDCLYMIFCKRLNEIRYNSFYRMNEQTSIYRQAIDSSACHVISFHLRAHICDLFVFHFIHLALIVRI